MRQFINIFKFELSSYFKNKVFVGITLALVIGIAVVLFFPRISSIFASDENSANAQKDVILLSFTESINESSKITIPEELLGKKIEFTDKSVEEMTALVDSGKYDSAIAVISLTKYVYIVKNKQMYDKTSSVIDGLLLEKYRMESMSALGVSPEKADEILSTAIESELIQTGKDQMQNFFYTYILIFALYMAIVLYGQLVATSVATEKSSRAMEVLITSAKPVNLMFGKVLGAGTAGLLQIAAVLGSAFIFFNLNKASWEENDIVNSIFNMPLSIMLYTMLFFVLGFLIYSFLYGAVGSLASKVEDINTSSMPITFLFIISFFVVMFSMASGNVDSPLMTVASYVPFTSPMAMFVRIAMSDVAAYEIIISVAILIASVVGIGVLSAKIYQIGVLLYGKPPKLSNILGAVIRNK